MQIQLQTGLSLAHNDDAGAHGSTDVGRAVLTAGSSAIARAALEIPESSTSVVASGSTTARTYAERFADVANVLDFGAQGVSADDGFDSLPAFNAALATGRPVYVPQPPSGWYYRVSGTIVVPNNGSLFGAANRSRIVNTSTTAQPVVALVGQGGHFVANLWLDAISSTQQTATGLWVDGGAGPNTLQRATVENILMIGFRWGLRVSGAVYFCNFRDITVRKAWDSGIRLDDRDGTGLMWDGEVSGPNANTFEIKVIDGARSTIEGTGSAVVHIQKGSLNTFIGGELGGTHADSQSEYIVRSDKGGSNRFLGCYCESLPGSECALIKTGDDGDIVWESYGFVQKLDLGKNSVIHGTPYGGGRCLTQQRLAVLRSCQALWLFNEGSGSTIIDHSGNGRHLRMTSATPTWSDGMESPALDINVAEGKYLDLTQYSSALAPSTPWTVVMQIKRTGSVGNPVVLGIFNSDASRYFRITRADSYHEVTDYNGSNALIETHQPGMITTHNAGFAWIALVVNPSDGTVTWLDPVSGPLKATSRCSAWSNGEPGEMSFGHMWGSSGYVGSVGFLGFWSRELSLLEVQDIANLRSAVIQSSRPRTAHLISEYAVEGATTTRTHRYGSAAPTTGTWRAGDIVYSTAPAAGGSIGWVCTTAGMPGTWKSFGSIAS